MELVPLGKPFTTADLETLRPGEWPLYRKTALTHAIRVRGPFEVVTSETAEGQTFHCQDGYLAVDARGYPYAIATEEFERIYEVVR